MKMLKGLEEAKRMVLSMKWNGDKTYIATGIEPTPEAREWIQSHNMVVKDKCNITVIAEKEEYLPSDEEFEKAEEMTKLLMEILSYRY